MVSIHTYIRGNENRPSPTYDADRLGKELQKNHSDTILLTLGELDLSPTNGFINRALQQAAEKAPGDLLYQVAKIPGGSGDEPEDVGKGCNYPPAQGTPEFRRTAAFRFYKDTGIVGAEENHIAVLPGGKGVLTAIGSAFKAGDEVIVAGPGWPTNYDFWPVGTHILEVDTEGRGLISAEQLAEALKRHPNVKAVLINDPCNPTGARYTPDEREAVMKVINQAREKNPNLLAVVDDPYGALTYNGATMQRGEEEKELFNTGGMVVANSVSKVYARPDLRVGYAVTKNEKLLKTIVKYIQTASASVPVEIQNKAQALLLFGNKFIEETAAHLEKRTNLLADKINAIEIDGEPLLSMQKPQGAIYGWINCSKLQGASYKGSDGKMHAIDKPEAVAQFMRDQAHVAPVDGGPFYAPGSPAASQGWFVRVVLTDEKILARACDQLENALNKITMRQLSGSAAAVNGR